jgi:hypothetical protein
LLLVIQAAPSIQPYNLLLREASIFIVVTIMHDAVKTCRGAFYLLEIFSEFTSRCPAERVIELACDALLL